MTNLEALQRLYGEYLDKARKAEANRKPFDGIFGFGKRKGKDPCHGRFAEDFETLMKVRGGRRP